MNKVREAKVIKITHGTQSMGVQIGETDRKITKLIVHEASPNFLHWAIETVPIDHEPGGIHVVGQTVQKREFTYAGEYFIEWEKK